MRPPDDLHIVNYTCLLYMQHSASNIHVQCIYPNECGYTWRHIPFWVLDSPRYTSELPFGLCILWCYWALVQSWARYTFCIDFFLKLRTALRVSNLIAMAQIQFIIPYSITLLLHSRFYLLPVNGNKKQYELLKHCS